MPSKSNSKGSGPKGQTKPPQSTIPSGSSELKPLSQQAPEIARRQKQQAELIAAQSASYEEERDGGVNRKKQKKRSKEAAKRTAELQNADALNSSGASNLTGQTNGYDYPGSEYEDANQYEPDDGDDVYYTDEATSHNHPGVGTGEQYHVNGHAHHGAVSPNSANAKSKKKKKKRGTGGNQDVVQQAQDGLTSKDRIWNTSTAEERERIKEFWLSLGEDDRRSLVKVEKEAVLKKMKEQQKHSCSCTVCGRKRTAIEEELEVLYDAYYEELEQYANHQQINIEDSHSGLPTSRALPHPLSRQNLRRNSPSYNRHASRARIHEIGDEDDAGGEEVDSEAIAEDEYSDDYIEPEPEPTPAAADFFNFGNSLTVQGGILTVADDLLKNDGKKFIEMMEQLAERRMQREEDAQYAASGMNMQHNHASALDDELYDDEDEEEDYDSQEDEEFEEDDMETMTEEQRMEEGRRMFQIFAARMFEQRVLTAYREKVALERQQKLIEELDDETRIDAQREAKKAKEAQKKKDKKRQQKLARDEEKAKKDAEKAAEEAEAKAKEEQKAEEQRLRKEEQRKKREVEKKLLEEGRARKEAEKQRKLQEARDLQAEQERKQREQKEREKKKREESKKRERDEREAKEKEAKEKREREAAEKKDREVKSHTLNGKDQSREEKSSKPIPPAVQHLPKKPSPANASTLSMPPPGLQPPISTSSHTSPHLPIATPVVPKAPTPVRPRQPSFQDSRATSPKSSHPANSATTSPTAAAVQPVGAPTYHHAPKQPTPPQLQQSQVRYSPKDTSPGSKIRPPGLSQVPSTSGGGFGPTISEVMSPFASMPIHHPGGNGIGVQHPSYIPGTTASYASGISQTAHLPQGRGKMEAPQIPSAAFGRPSASFGDPSQSHHNRENIASHTHSRNTSTSSNVATSSQPIGRPVPIQRPSSTTPQQHGGHEGHQSNDMDDLADHLGSKALLGDDDDDVPLTSPVGNSRRGSMAIGGHRDSRAGFGGPTALPNPIGSTRHDAIARPVLTTGGTTWSSQQSMFNSPTKAWPPSSGFSRTNKSTGFGSIGEVSHQQSNTRAITIRTLLVQACHKPSQRSPVSPSLAGWHRMEDLHQSVQLARPNSMPPISMQELIETSEAAGNSQNGGGAFQLHTDHSGLFVRFHPSRTPSMTPTSSEIGSPISGGPPMFGGPQRPFPPSGGFPYSTGF